MSEPIPTDMPSHIFNDAKTIYNYHKMNLPLPTPQTPSDAIFCLCSLDLRVAHRATQLHLDGLAPLLIFSGNTGALTSGLFSKPEADVFADVARGMGVPEERILIEPEATNTGENVRLTHALLRRRGIVVRALVLVQKPYMERRTYATFRKQWPDPETEFTVTSPQMDFETYPDSDNPRHLVTSIMVGDLVRMREYPARGFQIEQPLPEEVWEAGQRLIKAGYGRHLP